MYLWPLGILLVGSCISVVGWVLLVRHNYDPLNPGTLSQLSSRDAATFRYFRTVLWVCGPLFAVGGVMVAYALRSPLLGAVWVITVLLEMLVGIFPAAGRGKRLHEMFAYGMAVCMMIGAVLAAVLLPRLRLVEWLLVVSMAGCALMAALRSHHFVFYELAYIFTAHLTMIVAAIALH